MMVYAVEVRERTLAAAMLAAIAAYHGVPEKAPPWTVRWRYFRFRWLAKFYVWFVNRLGAGPNYEDAKYLGETL